MLQGQTAALTLQFRDDFIIQLKDSNPTFECSQNWMIYYCWIQMITDLLCYKVRIYKDSLTQYPNSSQTQKKWNDLIQKNIIKPLPQEDCGIILFYKNYQLIESDTKEKDLKYKIDKFQIVCQYTFVKPDCVLFWKLNRNDQNILLVDNESQLEIQNSFDIKETFCISFDLSENQQLLVRQNSIMFSFLQEQFSGFQEMIQLIHQFNKYQKGFTSYQNQQKLCFYIVKQICLNLIFGIIFIILDYDRSKKL